MKRLIDVDAFIDSLDYFRCGSMRRYRDGIEDTIKRLKEFPTIKTTTPGTSDLIDRKALLHFIEIDRQIIAPERHRVFDILQIIKSAPAIETEPIVRCKDCEQADEQKGGDP